MLHFTLGILNLVLAICNLQRFMQYGHKANFAAFTLNAIAVIVCSARFFV